MTDEQKQVLRQALLGLYVLKTMLRGARLRIGEARTIELIEDFEKVFPGALQ